MIQCQGKTKLGKRCKNICKNTYCHLHIHDYIINFNFRNDTGAPEMMYCGLNTTLPRNYDVMGTRNKCLKKGIGVGMTLPDEQRREFLNRARVDNGIKNYCGDAITLPLGYSGFGTLKECLQKGVGIGLGMDQRRRKTFQSRPSSPLNKIEIINIARRLGVKNINSKTRGTVLNEIKRNL